MDKAIKLIAIRLQISEQAALLYCKLVQKYFKRKLPPFKLIAALIEKHPGASVQQIALMINPDLRYEPGSKRTSAGWSGEIVPNADNKKAGRIDPGKAKKCVHGIPFWRKCAICNPNEFSDLYG